MPQETGDAYAIQQEDCFYDANKHKEVYIEYPFLCSAKKSRNMA